MNIGGVFNELSSKRYRHSIKRIKRKKDLSLREVNKLTGISYSHLNMIENNKRNVTPALLRNLANIYNVNYIDLYVLAGYMDLVEDAYERQSTSSLNSNIVSIPLLGTVKAGYDYLANENIVDYIPVTDSSLDNENFFALKVKGDSMVPEIYEGDIAIVKKQDDFENGDYVVALINGDEATIKKGFKSDTGLLLQPVNTSIPPLIFDEETIKSMPVKIIGVVYNITRSFK